MLSIHLILRLVRINIISKRMRRWSSEEIKGNKTICKLSTLMNKWTNSSRSSQEATWCPSKTWLCNYTLLILLNSNWSLSKRKRRTELRILMTLRQGDARAVWALSAWTCATSVWPYSLLCCLLVSSQMYISNIRWNFKTQRQKFMNVL